LIPDGAIASGYRFSSAAGLHGKQPGCMESR
jgi:hypothetical protein